MSFSSDTKTELCRLPVNRRCCALAEIYGILLYCNAFSPRGVRIITENRAFADRIGRLLRKGFSFSYDAASPPDRPGKRVITIDDPDKLHRIHAAYGQDERGGPSLHINFAVLEEDCCRVAFLRCVFLAGGSVIDPEKRYHLELVTSHLYVSRELEALMREVGFEARSTARSGNYVTYFKQREKIEDFLTAIGAPVAAMAIMNAAVERSLRNRVNRRVNCDAANLDKSVDAALTQLEAIRRIEAAAGLESLPEHLRQTAALRLAYPEMTLAQLAEAAVPPVTKSCMSHRLRRIIELSQEQNT